MAAKKVTTGLAGLFVSQHPHHVLGVLYNKIDKVLLKMPEDAAYRKYTGDLVSHRRGILNSEPDVAKVEEKIGSGQIEELIEQAKGELNLARNMLEWKPWEPLISEPPKNQWQWPIRN